MRSACYRPDAERAKACKSPCVTICDSQANKYLVDKTDTYQFGDVVGCFSCSYMCPVLFDTKQVLIKKILLPDKKKEYITEFLFWSVYKHLVR